jgi:hypothetical protein
VIDSKAKGSRFEREIARTLRAKRTPLSGASGGGDVSFPTDSIWADWSMELKRRAKLPAFVTAALRQAAGDIRIGDRRKPAVVMREDGGPAIFVCYLDDLRPWVEALAEVGRAGRVHDLGRQLEAIAHELRSVT